MADGSKLAFGSFAKGGARTLKRRVREGPVSGPERMSAFAQKRWPSVDRRALWALLSAMPGSSSIDANKFIVAQSGVYEAALAEIRRGRKTGHWMWFIFPQLAGLGSSPTARHYAIASLEEARAYLAHPQLGSRLRTCAAAAADLRGRTALEVFGHPDDLKLRSSMTLFEEAAPHDVIFGRVLDVLCGGKRDEATLHLLGSAH